MTTKTLASIIVNAVVAKNNCIKNGNKIWEDNHELMLSFIEKNYLPSGSGVDSGTKIDREKTTANKLVLNCSFHHMNAEGYYVRWSDYVIVAECSFLGLDIKVKGQNHNDIKDYLADLFQEFLSKDYDAHVIYSQAQKYKNLL